MSRTEEWAELAAENAQANADGDWSCVFDSDVDTSIEPGYGCGGCSCHLSAPCHHCMTHLPEEDSHAIGLGVFLRDTDRLR